MTKGITIDGAVVVVTGASSGIGRATALAFAERGASVVVAARSEEDLEQVVLGCEQRGAAALAVPTDVAEREEVDHLAARAIERFGRFDAWINAAAVMAYGSFWDVPVERYRQVLETNLFGTIHGARAAIDHFRDRDGAGVLINVVSVYGRVVTPYVSPYVVSKHAIRGFSQCLRQETAKLPGVAVCAVYPQAVDTPIFRHAANYTGREVTALPLAIDPDRVVRAIVRCAERPRAETIVGVFGHVVAWGRALLPHVYERVTPELVDRIGFRSAQVPESDGNVVHPEPELNAIDGGWREERQGLRRAAAGAGAVALAVPAAVWLARRAA